MSEWMGGWFEKLLIAVASSIATIGGPKVWAALVSKKKIDAEAQHITTKDEMSLFEMERQVAKDYIALFRETTVELKQAGAEIRQMQDDMKQVKERHANVCILARRMFAMLKENNAPGWQDLEAEVNAL